MQTNKSEYESPAYSTRLTVLQQQLSSHPLYSAIQDKTQLRLFMQQHVFAVWDFMSLIKSAQSLLAPTTIPWVPSKHPQYVHFINQLVSEEESDHEYPELENKLPCSHFEHYLDAMAEISADTTVISMFIDTVRQDGIDIALELPEIHSATKEFVTFTFDVIKQNQPHLTVAALALGREDLVPQLFRSLENNLQITRYEAPKFFHYLDRHIQLDEQQHGPIALSLLDELCGNSSKKYAQAMEIAEQALTHRLALWDAIYCLISPNQQVQSFQSHCLAQ